ncbi:MAG: orotate phosphoribosyltransferase [Oscillospiraceae bacterium]|jgi:orotate phosphoribosyltransferase|nr:orotate phosphoribosyltransferase [Oscillospiraceae bacterium]
MADYKQEFVSFLLETGALKFGEFTLKSGRKSPYFLNLGNFNTGAELSRLCGFYADAILASGVDFNLVFGPAYKGIPLAAGTAIELSRKTNGTYNFAFDRKEVKDHGDGGMFVGKTPSDGDKIIIIDDVITSGKATGETVAKLSPIHGIKINALFTAVDRSEKSLDNDKSASANVSDAYGFPVYSVVTIYDILDTLTDTAAVTAIKGYLAEYGAK